jgi:hypothetical protein
MSLWLLLTRERYVNSIVQGAPVKRSDEITKFVASWNRNYELLENHEHCSRPAQNHDGSRSAQSQPSAHTVSDVIFPSIFGKI